MRIKVITGLTCSDHFGMNRPWDFLIRRWFYKNVFSLPIWFCLYGLTSIAKYSNHRIWSVRTRNVANIVRKRMVRALPQWSSAAKSKANGSGIRDRFFRITQTSDVFGFEFAPEEEESLGATVAMWYKHSRGTCIHATFIETGRMSSQSDFYMYFPKEVQWKCVITVRNILYYLLPAR